MEVVIEETMFVGVALNFLILKLSARILRRKVRLVLLSALVGEIISLFSPLFKIHFLLKFLLIILSCILMLCISFEFVSFKNFSILLGVFSLATFVFGGACFALQSLIGSFPLFLVAFIGIIVYTTTLLLNRSVFKSQRHCQFVYKVKIKDRGKVVEEEGYLDSGNVLYDAISGQPIILVNFDVFHKIYKQINLIDFLANRYDISSIKNGHYIKINSIGKGGKMLVFSVDEVVVEGDKYFENVMLGLSFSGFEKSFGKNVLLHCDMV